MPFHFFEGTPYYYRVKYDNPDYGFAVICVARDEVKNNCFITKGHPLNYHVVEKLKWDYGMEQIDWDAINKHNYKDRDCKQASMSEALYIGDMPNIFFKLIKVPDLDIKEKLEKIKSELGLSFEVEVDFELAPENIFLWPPF